MIFMQQIHTEEAWFRSWHPGNPGQGEFRAKCEPLHAGRPPSSDILALSRIASMGNPGYVAG
jgi:hypothetical protein